MTMPQNAASLLTSVFGLMKGLKLPWHRRRLTKEARRDICAVIKILQSNHGRGYFSYEHLPYADDIYTDASKERRFAGGGFVSMDGTYDWWEYGSSLKRRPIAYLEGDAVVRAVENLKDKLRGKRVRIFCDNQSFTFSLRKGRSKADALNSLVRSLFELSSELQCIFEPHWISTHCNVMADYLSRNRCGDFLAHVREHYPGISFKRCGDGDIHAAYQQHTKMHHLTPIMRSGQRG